jgi:hypothetical protein
MHAPFFTRIHQADNRGAKLFPPAMLADELLLAGLGELVIFGALAVLRRSPFGSNPALLFQPVQCRVQGAGFRLQDLAGAGADRLADAIAMLRSAAQRLQNKHVERALEQLDPTLVAFTFAHGIGILLSQAVACLQGDSVGPYS